jgi:hypothetical protein
VAESARDDHAEIVIAGSSCGRGATKIPSEGKETDPGGSTRERLAELIVAARWSGSPLHPAEAACERCGGTRVAADAILAAGWRPPLPGPTDYEPEPPSNPVDDPVGTVRRLRSSWYVKLSRPAEEPWHIACSDGPQRYSGWQDNETMADCPVVGYLPITECAEHDARDAAAPSPLPDSETEPDAMQWGYREHPAEDVEPVLEKYARFRAQDEHLTLVQREVRYGPWIEVTS